MGRKMHRTQIYLDETQYNYVVEQSQNKKVSMAEVIRSLIDQSMPKASDYENNPLFNQSKKALKLNIKDAAKNHDKYIYNGK